MTEMRAVRYERYGPPDVLEVRNVPVPEPRSGEVLIRVSATSVNPVEAQVRAGRMRPMSGFRFPKGTGQDFSGEVVAVGPGVDPATVGRRVWGTKLGLGSATAAEYVQVKESLTAQAPAGYDLVAAAALPTVGLTAITGLRTVRVRPGSRVLVVGASGGIGSVAIQLARAAGARVSAVAAARNAEFCADLGADVTYDYQRLESLADAPRFDAIIDLYGASLGRYRRQLATGGRMISLASKGMGYVILSSVLPGPRVRMAMMKPKRADLDELAAAVVHGDLRSVVEETYPLDSIAEAHRSIESGHSRGKRVIRITEGQAT